jgi:hypothetical protein
MTLPQASSKIEFVPELTMTLFVSAFGQHGRSLDSWIRGATLFDRLGAGRGMTGSGDLHSDSGLTACKHQIIECAKANWP